MKTAFMCHILHFVVAGIFTSTLGSIPTSLTGCMGHWGDLTGSMGRTSLEEREGRRTELDTACAFICLTWQLCIELTVLSVHSPEHSYCNELFLRRIFNVCALGGVLKMRWFVRIRRRMCKVVSAPPPQHTIRGPQILQHRWGVGGRPLD